MPVYLGLSDSDTRKLVKAVEHTAAWPVDGYLIACPYFTRPSQAGMVRHFSLLAEATRRPILIYNIPYRTGVNLGNDAMLELAARVKAEVSTRHLSFVETGRAAPSRDMLLRLAERLDVPLRARNELLHAGGFAAIYAERPLNAPEMTVARRTVEAVLAAHAPFPALAIDRHWTLVTANAAVPPLLAGVAAHLLAPPVNVLRLSLHPDGLAPRIVNLGEWRAHLLAGLQGQVDNTGDAVLRALRAELAAYPFAASLSRPGDFAGIAVPCACACRFWPAHSHSSAPRRCSERRWT